MKYFQYAVFGLVVLTISLVVYIFANKVNDMPFSELQSRWALTPSQFVAAQDMQIHFRDQGDRSAKETILLIHGTGASLHTWEGWINHLTPKYRVITLDIPGFGLTGPEPNNNYTIENYVETIVKVMDNMSIQRAVIGGNSLGGYIAWATALLHPERVSRLILVDPSGYPSEAQSVPIAFKISQYPMAKVLLNNFLPKWLVRSSVRNVYGNPDLVTETLVQRYYELSLREGNRAALAARFAQTQPGPLAARLTEISQPTLILWGAKDKLIPVTVSAVFASQIAHNELVIFDSLGHVPHEEDPNMTIQPVLQFLSNTNDENAKKESRNRKQ